MSNETQPKVRKRRAQNLPLKVMREIHTVVMAGRLKTPAIAVDFGCSPSTVRRAFNHVEELLKAERDEAAKSPPEQGQEPVQLPLPAYNALTSENTALLTEIRDLLAQCVKIWSP